MADMMPTCEPFSSH